MRSVRLPRRNSAKGLTQLNLAVTIDEMESHKTDFWAAKANGPNQLVGENNLGILLVELREEFRALKPSDPHVVKPLPIPNFTLMGKPVPAFTG